MLRNIVKVSDQSLTAVECKELKEQSVVSDERSEFISALHPIAMQFFVHMTMNSKPSGDGFVNTYSGRVLDGEGLYPSHPDHPLRTPEGMFKEGPDGGLPAINFSDGKTKWLTGDINRSTENSGLSATHLFWHRVHNKNQLDTGSEFLARVRTMALVSRFFMNEFMEVTGMDQREIFDGVVRKGAVNTLETIFGFGRWGHAMVPETIGGIPIFEKVQPVDYDLKAALADKARVINFGCSPTMANMASHDTDKDIIDRNLGRHVTVNMGDWGDFKQVYRHHTFDQIPDRTPIFTAILMEADLAGTGRLHGVGARLIADIAADALQAPRGYGLWCEEWEGKPSTQAEILGYLDAG